MENRIITINGMPTRIWTYHPTYGYGCGECCNGDRCDDDCTAKYRRPSCPHCKGKGWFKEIPVSDYETLQSKVEAMEKALGEIAIQKTCAEQEADEDIPIGSDGTRLGDIEYAYDCCIETAREALKVKEGEK